MFRWSQETFLCFILSLNLIIQCETNDREDLLQAVRKELLRGLQLREHPESVDSMNQVLEERAVNNVEKLNVKSGKIKENTSTPPSVDHSSRSWNSTKATTPSIGEKIYAFFVYFSLVLHIPLWLVFVLFGLLCLILILILYCCCCMRKKKNIKGRKKIPSYSSEEWQECDVGILDFTLEYNKSQEQFIIGIVCIKEIVSIVEKSTFVRMQVKIDSDFEETLPQIFQTKEILNSNNPKYNETFKVKCSYNELSKTKIIFEVFDYKKYGRNQVFGRYDLDLSDQDNAPINYIGSTWERSVILKKDDTLDRGKGDICLSLRYAPAKKELLVNVLEAKNVSIRRMPNKKPNVFVRVIFKRAGAGGKQKKETQLRRHNSNPYFNQDMHFTISDLLTLKEGSLKVYVFHSGSLFTQKIGKVVLSCQAEGAGKMHWERTINNPRTSMAHWHSIM